ncbi:MAG: hypothetical protein IJY27_05000 [Clostridia bacterium]|nr:hypothetical protein [Clostridia bacterium]
MKNKKHKKASGGLERVTPSEKKPFNWRLLLVLACNTVILFSVYRVAITFHYFEIVLGIYLAATAGLTLAYVIYNRGFTRRGVTAEMLPDTMSAEEKCEFIADGERRLKKSKWMLTILIPLIITFTYDLMELFLFDRFAGLFG